MSLANVIIERLADRHDETREGLFMHAASHEKYLDGVGYLRGLRDAISIIEQTAQDLEYAPRNT